MDLTLIDIKYKTNFLFWSYTCELCILLIQLNILYIFSNKSLYIISLLLYTYMILIIAPYILHRCFSEFNRLGAAYMFRGWGLSELRLWLIKRFTPDIVIFKTINQSLENKIKVDTRAKSTIVKPHIWVKVLPACCLTCFGSVLSRFESVQLSNHEYETYMVV